MLLLNLARRICAPSGFFCTSIFGHGIPIYTINRHFEEIEDTFDDGSHIIYVNGCYKEDDAIGRLMQDFACKESKDIYHPELAKGVKHFKEEEGGRKIMSDAVKKYAEGYAERYAAQRTLDKQLEMVKNLMDSMKMTAEQAMTALKVNDKEKAVLLENL